MTRTSILAALIAAAFAVGGCSGDDSDKAGGEGESEAVVLTLANPDDGTFDLDEFTREVESQSDGSVRIEVTNNWRDGEVESGPETIADVRDGKADLGSIGARSFDLAGVTSLQPLVAPFAVDSYALEGEVLASPLAERMLGGVESADVVGITLLPGEMRKPLGVSRPLVEASDYRGATIGIAASKLSARTFEALGASAEGVHLSDDISSVDGLEAQVITIEGGRYDGPAQTLAANVNLWPRALVIVMNEDSYDALTEDQREALSAAGRAALDPSLRDIETREKEAISILCNRGELAVRSASRSQLEALYAATAPVTQALNRDPAARDAARQIAAMRAEVDPDPAPTCPDDASGPSAEGPTPVDGLWRMETTEAEYAEIAPPADVVVENWGEFTFAFDRGRFAATTENGEACLWVYGSYALKGDLLEWTVEDGGGHTVTEPNFFNRAGEFFSFRWSRYRDQLTLSPVTGTISPEPFRVKPWRLLEGEPAVEALSSRCQPPADALGS